MSAILARRPMAQQSDRRLVELARDGDERAFETLTRRYWRQLLIYAGRLLGSDNRAEDACQQALLQAWLALRADTEVREARAWLYGIVHNSAVTIIRRAHHDTVKLDDAAGAPAPEASQEARFVLAEIFERLSAMPPDQRDALVMTAVRGQTRAETAAALGLSDGAVRGLVYRARASLRGAVAGVLPVGLCNWLTRFGDWLTPAAGNDTTAAAAGSAGILAAVIKGGAVLAAAGALVVAGPGSGSTSATGARHHDPVTAQRSITRRAAVAPNAQARVRHDALGQSGEAASERERASSSARDDEAGGRRDHSPGHSERGGTAHVREDAGTVKSGEGRRHSSDAASSDGASNGRTGTSGDGGSGKQDESGSGGGASPETSGRSGSGKSDSSGGEGQGQSGAGSSGGDGHGQSSGGSSGGEGQRQSSGGSEASTQSGSSSTSNLSSSSGPSDSRSPNSGSGDGSSSGAVSSGGGHATGGSSDTSDNSSLGSDSSGANLPG